ncbi:2'-5' RNA ligase family protein [Prauserella flavalba]|uniref:2'-5' RNA ligase n=1 Tax=Prauserella flavalba TaxID=1477506 RepID=A0A318LE43_9PSEU|nr:2'-5' RNA ligase family protein [Prauserella flavalba]PXY24340.1 2'-5' RNA ligase [Prauserella flavalba]
MALAVCVLFDGRSERALRKLWLRIEELGVPTLASHTHGRHHPHLSYVVLLDWDLVAVRAAVETLPDHGPFELSFDAVATFRRGRVSLVPAVPADLVSRQQAVVEAVRGTGALVHKHYETGRWLPHSSLATRAQTERLPQVASAVYDVLPLTVRATRAALIDSSTGEAWPLRNVP